MRAGSTWPSSVIRAATAAPAECPTARLGVASSVAQKIADRRRHARQGKPLRLERRGEAVTRQVGRDHREPAGQQRRQIAPGVGRRPRAVQQKQDGPLAHLLEVPAQPGSNHEAAGLAIGPVGAVALPGERVAHVPRPTPARNAS